MAWSFYWTVDNTRADWTTENHDQLKHEALIALVGSETEEASEVSWSSLVVTPTRIRFGAFLHTENDLTFKTTLIICINFAILFEALPRLFALF